MLRNNASIMALSAGHVEAAREHLEKAQAAAEAIGVTIYNVNISLGMVLREEGDPGAAAAMLRAAVSISRRTGDRFGLGYAVFGLACLAGDAGEWQRAAELHGVAQAFLDQIGQPWLPVYGRFLEGSIGAIQGKLGDQEYQRLYGEGRKLSVEEAIALAQE
jgi:hypothetical protein